MLLTANLGHHIAYSCKVRKYGTLVYRANADLIPLLSEALWKLQNAKSIQGNSSIDCSEKESDKDLGTMDSCFNHLSHLLHTQINIFWAKDAQAPFEYDELDFDDLTKQIDPQL